MNYLGLAAAVHRGEHLAIHRDPGRANEDDKDAGKNEQHQWEDQLDRGFSGFLFCQLTASRSHRLTLHAQRLSDAGAEFVGLNQNRRQLLEILDTAAIAEFLERLGREVEGVGCVEESG